jgi:hypothetical protein
MGRRPALNLHLSTRTFKRHPEARRRRRLCPVELEERERGPCERREPRVPLYAACVPKSFRSGNEPVEMVNIRLAATAGNSPFLATDKVALFEPSDAPLHRSRIDPYRLGNSSFRGKRLAFLGPPIRREVKEDIHVHRIEPKGLLTFEDDVRQ